MDKAIVTALLIVVGMAMALMLFNSAYPAVVEGGDAIANLARNADQRLKTQISIIHAAGELNSAGLWQDTNVDGAFNVFIWAKNIGSTRIIGLENLDVFYGPEGGFMRIPHQSKSGGALPYWNYALENAAEWTPSATLRITITFSAALGSGRYFSKVAVPSGAWAEYFLGL